MPNLDLQTSAELMDDQNYMPSEPMQKNGTFKADQREPTGMPDIGENQQHVRVKFDQEGPLGLNIATCPQGESVIVCGRKGNQYSVEEDSVAGQLGLMRGDVIVAVQGQSVVFQDLKQVKLAIKNCAERPLFIDFLRPRQEEDQGFFGTTMNDALNILQDYAQRAQAHIEAHTEGASQVLTKQRPADQPASQPETESANQPPVQAVEETQDSAKQPPVQAVEETQPTQTTPAEQDCASSHDSEFEAVSPVREGEGDQWVWISTQ